MPLCLLVFGPEAFLCDEYGAMSGTCQLPAIRPVIGKEDSTWQFLERRKKP